MLKPYESETRLFKEVPIEPHLLNCNLERIIKDKLWDLMKTVCSGEYGFVLRLNSIDAIGQGTVDTNNGSVVYPVKFTITSFKPKVEDIVIARITAVSKSGFFAQLGPLEIFVPHTHIPDNYEYKFVETDGSVDQAQTDQSGITNLSENSGNSVFQSEYTTISKGEFVRLKVCAIQKMDIEQIFDSLSIKDRPKSPYIGGVLEAIGELVDE